MANKPSENTDNPQLDPGAWSRFERAVDAAVNSGPKHKPTQEKTDKKAVLENKGSDGKKKK